MFTTFVNLAKVQSTADAIVLLEGRRLIIINIHVIDSSQQQEGCICRRVVIMSMTGKPAALRSPTSFFAN